MDDRHRSPPSEDESRVVSFHRERPVARPPGPPVADLTQYERSPDEPDDYRHRMIVNAAAFVFVVALICGAIWLADTMARMRQDQDCVLSGRRGCTPVEVRTDRW